MKKFFLIVSLLLIWHISIAEELDAIITKSREQIQCYVISYNDSIVVVNAPDVNDKEEYTIPISNIDKIYLHTGELIVPGKEIDTWKPKPKEQSIAANPQLTELSNSQENQQVTQNPQPQPSVLANNTEANEKFKLFMTVLKDGITSEAPEKGETNTSDQGHTYISIFIIGLDENQQDVGQIIGSDVLARLSTIEGYRARLDSFPDVTPIDSIANIAQSNGSKLAFVIINKPFRDAFFLQSKLIDTDKGDILVTSRSASPLSSLENILSVAEELTLPVEEYLKNQVDLRKKREELSKIDKEAETARLSKE